MTSVSSINKNKLTNAKKAAEQAASHRATHGELFQEVFLPIAGCLCDTMSWMAAVKNIMRIGNTVRVIKTTTK